MVLVGRLKRGASEQSMIIRGLRGVAKTVLLNAFEDTAEAEGFLSYYHELTPASSLVAEIARDTQLALGRLKLTTRAARALREALAQLGTIKLVSPDGFELAVDLRRADEGMIARDSRNCFCRWGRSPPARVRGWCFCSMRCSSQPRSSTAR